MTRTQRSEACWSLGSRIMLLNDAQTDRVAECHMSEVRRLVKDPHLRGKSPCCCCAATAAAAAAAAAAALHFGLLAGVEYILPMESKFVHRQNRVGKLLGYSDAPLLSIPHCAPRRSLCARQSRDYWGLMQALGETRASHHCASSSWIERATVSMYRSKKARLLVQEVCHPGSIHVAGAGCTMQGSIESR